MEQRSEKREGKVNNVQGLSSWTGGLLPILVSRQGT